MKTNKSSYYLECGQLFDGNDCTMKQNYKILVRNGRIEEIGPHVICPADAEKIDLTHCTVTPGLIDAHVHYQHTDWRTRNHDAIYKGGVWRSMAYLYNARKSLYRGFTTIRCVGGSTFDYYGGIAARDMIREGYFDGSRLVMMPYYCCTPGSHGDHSQYIRENPLLAEAMCNSPTCGSGPEFFRNAVRKEVKYGAEFAKIFINGGVSTPYDEPTDESMTVDEARSVIETAHQLHIPVTAHVYGDATMNKLLDLGIDGMEHGSFISERTARRFEETDTYLVPTMCCLNDGVHQNPESLAQKAPHYARKLIRYAEAFREGRKTIIASNIRLGYGTDFVANYNPYDCGREFECWFREGMDPYRILTAMTSINAGICRIQDETGTLAEGKLADISAWHLDPLKDPLAVLDCSFVMKEGIIYPVESSLR